MPSPWGPELRLIPMYYRARGTSESRARDLNDKVRALREGRVSYANIAVVMAVYENLLVGENEIREWCYRLGFEKNPNKARPGAGGQRWRVAA